MEESSGGVPAWVVSGLVCLLLSVPGTYVGLILWGYKTGESGLEAQEEALARRGKDSAAPGTPKASGDVNEGGPRGELVKGAKGARPSSLIVTLVEKLDALTVEPGKLQLNADQRTKLVSALNKLAEPDFLGDTIAHEHMTAMLDVLKGQRKVLEDAGFAWPGSNQPQPSPPSQNPFKSGAAADHLSALKERLAKAA
jgi:hypothetical protein